MASNGYIVTSKSMPQNMLKPLVLCVLAFASAVPGTYSQTAKSNQTKREVAVFDFSTLSQVNSGLNPEIDIQEQSVQKIKDLLVKMFEADQQFRDSLYNGSKEAQKQQYYLSKIWNIDIINQKLLDKIVQIHGWPTPSKFDERSAEIAWLIVWHGQIDYKKKYLSVLQQAFEAKKIHPNYYHSLRKKLTNNSSN